MPIEPPEHNIYANPPTPPGDPPNEHNVASAIRYEAQIVQSYLIDRHGDMPEDIVVAAAQYRASVSAANALDDAMPNWFMPAMQAALTPMRREVRDMRRGVRDIKNTLYNVRVMLLKNVNSQRGSGAIQAFEIVPFSIIVNNQQVLQEPTGPPHNLPPLHTLENIRELTHHESREYYHGYYEDQQPLRHADRIQQIAFAIGCNFI